MIFKSRRFLPALLTVALVACGGSGDDEENTNNDDEGGIENPQLNAALADFFGEYRGSSYSTAITNYLDPLYFSISHILYDIDVTASQSEADPNAVVLEFGSSEYTEIGGSASFSDPSSTTAEPYTFVDRVFGENDSAEVALLESGELSVDYGSSILYEDDTQRLVLDAYTENYHAFGDLLVSSGEWNFDTFAKSEGQIGDLITRYTENYFGVYAKKPATVNANDLDGNWGGFGIYTFYSSVVEPSSGADSAFINEMVTRDSFTINGVDQITGDRSFCDYRAGVGYISGCDQTSGINPSMVGELELGVDGAIIWKESDYFLIEGDGSLTDEGWVNSNFNLMYYPDEGLEGFYIGVKRPASITFSELTNHSFVINGFANQRNSASFVSKTRVGEFHFELKDGEQLLVWDKHILNHDTLRVRDGEAELLETQLDFPGVVYRLDEFSEDGFFKATSIEGIGLNPPLVMTGYIMSDGDGDGKPDGILLLTEAGWGEEVDPESVTYVLNGIGIAGIK